MGWATGRHGQGMDRVGMGRSQAATSMREVGVSGGGRRPPLHGPAEIGVRGAMVSRETSLHFPAQTAIFRNHP
jgi:hypothetical protein